MKPKTSQQQKLYSWYQQNKRPLPWRTERKNPYKIWISEVMLQQTTSTAVIPFYKRFLKTFPTLKKLALAEEGLVLENWAGLGYYSRARNLHKAAKALHTLGQFPRSWEQLIELPGFGPYTSRSVSSIAFGEPVGVIDGNVIRVLSRWTNTGFEWWKTKDRDQLQFLADQFVTNFESGEINQALMEVGATICLPLNPHCLLCPLSSSCEARKKQTQTELPLKKPKKAKQIWLWKPQLVEKKQKIAFVKNDYAPFLKGQWFLPGSAKQLKAKPKTYDFKHNVTHHEIYISIDQGLPKGSQLKQAQWVKKTDSKKLVPASLIQKCLSDL